MCIRDRPWVLKITVKHDLGKWFGRAVDSTEADASDADAYADGGYKIDVEIPSHVFANNENGAWYDRLLVAPWDDESSGKASPASSVSYTHLDVYKRQGDGDYAAETGKTYEAQRSGTIDDRDLYVFGRPYVYKGQTTSDEDDAMNTVTAHGDRSAHPDKPVASTAIHTDGYRFTPSDQAYYLGYLIPFSAGYRITGTDGSTADRNVFDYQDDNNTPSVVDHEVYFWNKKDENAGDRRSARITRATLKTEEYHNTGDGTWFRMQHVYLPAEFVDIKGNAAYGNWFKVDSCLLYTSRCV